ncbi:MAG: hypothetical protein Q8K75_00550 [Chlamydiales bacterium]|nr:hypothetical protein [Chlamydiales bacterium]
MGLYDYSFPAPSTTSSLYTFDSNIPDNDTPVPLYTMDASVISPETPEARTISNLYNGAVGAAETSPAPRYQIIPELLTEVPTAPASALK